MKLALGSDHTGIKERKQIGKFLKEKGIEYIELGPEEGEGAFDYPKVAAAVGHEVSTGEAELGILICGTGIGVSIAANKVHGVRAAAVHDIYTTQMSREHNHANVLCLGARTTDVAQMLVMVETFIKTVPEGGRHTRRVCQITEIEQEKPVHSKQTR